jgi:hypothetical protein
VRSFFVSARAFAHAINMSLPVRSKKADKLKQRTVFNGTLFFYAAAQLLEDA